MRVEVRALLRQLARRDRRDERIGVDLPVRMVQRDADLDAAVLEREDVLDVVARAELAVPVGPDLDHQLDVPERQRAERGIAGRCVNTTTSQAPCAGARRHDRLRADRAAGAVRVGNRFSNTATS